MKQACTDQIIDILLSSFDTDKLGSILSTINLELCRRKSLPPHLPLDIFTSSLSPLEALVKFFKEQFNLRFIDIAHALHRDETIIWSAYQSARTKMPQPFSVPATSCYIPSEIVCNAEQSTLCLVISYLVDTQGFSLDECAKILHRSLHSVQGIYARGKKREL